MRVKIKPLFDKSQTAGEIKSLVKKYSGDLNRIKIKDGGQLVPLSKLQLEKIFAFVKDLPYKRDNKPVEIVARPAIALSGGMIGSGNDCKKKAILMASWLNENGVPWRLIGSSNRRNKSIHHVFPQGQFAVNGEKQWLNLDATYPHFKPFQRKLVTKWAIL